MKQTSLFQEETNLVNLKQASLWASKYLNKTIKPSNISYLIQYGKINRYILQNQILINISELKSYYDSLKFKLINNNNNDIDWHLSFIQYKESERTKHVHRLHPYKGKFIPQLVEYFLDQHLDEYKKEIFFNKDDIILDPFCGSGTTLVQANELGINAIGIDISFFNVLLSNIKVQKHNIKELDKYIFELLSQLRQFQNKKNYLDFENELVEKLEEFNKKFFPSPEYKKMIKDKKINENSYSKEKEKEFMKIYNSLIKKYKIVIEQKSKKSFLDNWYVSSVREEIDFLSQKIKEIKDNDIKDVLSIILSRTARSCRATTHADLATLKYPVLTTYYCKKHGKICKPIFSIFNWWQRYCFDTIKRLMEFDKIRTQTLQLCLFGDSRNIDIYAELRRQNTYFAKILEEKKIKGIFTSPPYVGLIDYHEQHAYAYEIFNFKRNDELEIGPLYKGQGEEARKSYVQSISEVLLNCKKYLTKDYNIFIVANDKWNLYPQIAKLSNMKIIYEFKRPVLNRVEKDRENLFIESIFHLKERE
ncbi:MAG: site-specific DNA-methyltransferase [Candidatus Goldbacteria bacterium]|nr:site-specific DNA-methyltransferase [Candidatus Goldiibacteriota bacterium]